MPADAPENVHVHVHLPEAVVGAGEEPRHDHVHLYLHTAAQPATGSAAGPEVRRGRPVLKAVAAVLLLGLATEAGYHFGSRSVAAGVTPAPAAFAVSPGARAAVPQMPPALAQELAQPPHRIPPPGGAGASGASTGQGAFGLGN